MVAFIAIFCNFQVSLIFQHKLTNYFTKYTALHVHTTNNIIVFSHLELTQLEIINLLLEQI